MPLQASPVKLLGCFAPSGFALRARIVGRFASSGFVLCTRMLRRFAPSGFVLAFAFSVTLLPQASSFALTKIF